MKKYLSVLLSVLLLLTAVPMGIVSVSAADEFAGGNGTESNPYLVSTKAQLNNVRNYLNAHFLLTADLVFTEADFEVDGPYYNDSDCWEPIGKFSGVFDGGDHTIYNLKVDTVDDYAGLFGKVSGTVCNLRLSNANIQGDSYLGALCGYNSGTIRNVCVLSSSVLGSEYVGGVCGYNASDVYDCYVTGTVTATGQYVGGISGYSGGDIARCYNEATVKTNSGYAGGITGYLNYNTTITSSVNTGAVTGSSYAGGIVGYMYGGNYGAAKVTNCLNKGVASGKRMVGDYYSPSYNSVSYCYDIVNNSIGGGEITSSYTLSGVGKEALSNKRTFIDWNFDTVWTMAGDVNYPYPELRCFTLQGAAAIEGTVAVGETVSASFVSSANQPNSLTYEWYVDNVLVDSGDTYTITAAAEGKELKVRAVSGDVLCAGHVASAVYTVDPPVDPSVPVIPTEPTIWVSTSEATAGDEIEVQVKLLNNPGVIAATVEILYDKDVMELVTYFDEEEKMWLPQIEVGATYNASSNKYITFGPIDDETGIARKCVVSYIRGTAKSNCTKEDFFTATFKIKDDAPCGTYPLTVSYDPQNFFAMGYADVAFGKQDGSVTITCAHANWDPCTGICPDCGMAVKPAHGNIIAVDAKDATCTEDGNVAYWYCDACGQVWLDEARTLNTTPEAVILPALGHNSVVHIAAKNSTCIENGNIEYWYCADCNKAWLDGDYTLPINLKAVFLPLEDHTYDDKYDAGCNVCGHIREVPVRPIFGDASGDGVVNGRDMALLQQYMADWDVIVDEAAADVNDNGVINARDVALLQQYIAGWDVKLG